MNFDGGVQTEPAYPFDPEMAYKDYIIRLEPVDQGHYDKGHISYLGVRMDIKSVFAALGQEEIDKLNFLGDPVNIVNGNFYWEYTDLTLNGKDDLSFTRSYNSRSSREGVMGYGWSHNWQYSLDNNDTYSLLHLPDGGTAHFNALPEGGYAWHKNDRYKIEETLTGYTVTSRDNTEYDFDPDGKLTTISDLFGEKYRLAYNGDKLHTVTGAAGVLTMIYDGDRIKRVTDSAGREIIYDYDINGDLVLFTNPDEDTLIYQYTDHLLEAITDFRGNVYLSNEYDKLGIVKSQTTADRGTMRYSYDYENRINTFTGTNGRITKYYYNHQQQLTKIEDVNTDCGVPLKPKIV